MGRGVRAAAVMGQLRAAVRAYARLDLPPGRGPGETWTAWCRDVGDVRIVTCVYAVYDAASGRSAMRTRGTCLRCWSTRTATATRLLAHGPPLGAGYLGSRPGTSLGAARRHAHALHRRARRTTRDRPRQAPRRARADHWSSTVTTRSPELPDTLFELLAGEANDDVALAVVKVHASRSAVIGCPSARAWAPWRQLAGPSPPSCTPGRCRPGSSPISVLLDQRAGDQRAARRTRAARAPAAAGRAGGRDRGRRRLTDAAAPAPGPTATRERSRAHHRRRCSPTGGAVAAPRTARSSGRRGASESGRRHQAGTVRRAPSGRAASVRRRPGPPVRGSRGSPVRLPQRALAWRGRL